MRRSRNRWKPSLDFVVNGLGNPWVPRATPIPNPAKTHTHAMGMGFCWVGFGLLVGSCGYVPVTGNPWVTFKKSI